MFLSLYDWPFFGFLFPFFSIDDAFINPQLQKIFERVRQSADFMPLKQMIVSHWFRNMRGENLGTEIRPYNLYNGSLFRLWYS